LFLSLLLVLLCLPAELLPFTRSLFVPRACFPHIMNFYSILLSLSLFLSLFFTRRYCFFSAASLQLTIEESPSRHAPGRRRRVSPSLFSSIRHFFHPKTSRVPRVSKWNVESVGQPVDVEES